MLTVVLHSIQKTINIYEKEMSLRCFLNIAILSAVLKERGREFQIIGPVTAKALSPNVFKLNLGTINNLESWDLRTFSGT